MTKKTILFLILTVFIVVGISGPVAAEDQDVDKYAGFPPDMRRILERGKLICAMYYNDIPPFFMHDDSGQLVGHDVELARDIADKLGVECEFNRSPKTFNMIIDTVVNHEADIGISVISATLKRAQRVRFANPYLILHPTLVMNRLTASRYTFTGKDPLKSIRDTNRKIGEKKGTSYVGIAREMFKKAEIVEYNDWDPTMTAVHSGKVFAALRDEIGVKNFILQKPEVAINMQMVLLKDEKDPIGIAVPSDSTHLLHWLNIYLKQYRPQITADDLLEKYAHIYSKSK